MNAFEHFKFGQQKNCVECWLKIMFSFMATSCDRNPNRKKKPSPSSQTLSPHWERDHIHEPEVVFMWPLTNGDSSWESKNTQFVDEFASLVFKMKQKFKI